MNQLLLENKVIVLVGGSASLGKVFAEEFIKEGATVVITGRTEKTLLETAEELKGKGGNVLPIVADYKNREDAVRVFKQAIGIYGKVDGLVTSASHPCKNISLEAADDEYIDNLVDTDIKGLIWYNREAMKHFIERDSGCILNIGSNNIGRPICDSVYCACKYAEWGMTKQMAMRCVATGVRCNLLNPGSFPSTSASSNLNIPHMYDAGELVQASGRIPVENGSMTLIQKARTNRAVPVDLNQVAYAAVYLLSDLAKDVNGQMFTVDRGGYL